jgi:transcriptional regulator with PAS, ATPase and Fis domain
VLIARRKREALERDATHGASRRSHTRRDVEDVEPLESLEVVMRRHVEGAVARSRTFAEAAQRLGINLTTLWRMRKRWELD